MKKNLEFKNVATNSRLNSVIKRDKQANPQYISEVIKSDFFYLINNYFEIEFGDIDLNIDVDNNNNYVIRIDAKGNRLKLFNALPYN